MSYSIIFPGFSIHKMVDWNLLKLNAGGRISKFFIEKKIFYSLEFIHFPTVGILHWLLLLFPPETRVRLAKKCILPIVILFFFFVKNQ
jgi:hypothetical protein